MILCKSDYAAAIDKVVFPGMQGGPLVHIVAAKAVCFQEAAQPAFKTYQEQIVRNARALAELSEKARAGKLNASEMQGGCFTISSLGGIGGTAFTPIINAPEVAILGVSKAAMKPVWKDNAFQPRLMLPLSFSYDHRVIDGALGARIAKFIADTLAKPKDLLGAMS